MQRDKLAYDREWLHILDGQLAAVHELAKSVLKNSMDKRFQPHQDLQTLFLQAETLHEWFQEVVRLWAASLGFVHERAPLKQKARVEQKVWRSYNGHAERVLDFVRSTIVVDQI